MKIVCISDTHAKTLPDSEMPAADVLVHAGDVTNNGKRLQMESMSEWFRHLADTKYANIVFIAGNHDFMLDGFRKEDSEYAIEGRLFRHLSIHYLRDSGITIDGKYFYGTPWTISGDWAFSEMDRMHRRDRFNKIPMYTNVLISHGPPYTIRDQTDNGGLYMSVGDIELLGAVDRVRPELHVFGHIHDGAGMTKLGDTTFVNAAVTRVKPNAEDPYPLQNPPIVIEI